MRHRVLIAHAPAGTRISVPVEGGSISRATTEPGYIVWHAWGETWLSRRAMDALQSCKHVVCDPLAEIETSDGD